MNELSETKLNPERKTSGKKILSLYDGKIHKGRTHKSKERVKDDGTNKHGLSTTSRRYSKHFAYIEDWESHVNRARVGTFSPRVNADFNNSLAMGLTGKKKPSRKDSVRS